MEKQIKRKILALFMLLVVTACNGQEQTEPLQVNTTTIQLPTGETVEVPAQHVISSGSNHTLVIRENGTVWAFGNNEYGQLGNGTTEASLKPVQVKELQDIVKVSAGRYFSAALGANGFLWMWGANENGRLGDGTTETKLTPVRVADSIADVAVGSFVVFALRDDGQLLGWGRNLGGMLGPQQALGMNILSPTILSKPADVAKISRQRLGSVVVNENGKVWAWGAASLTSGKFDYSDTEYPEPKQVLRLNYVYDVVVGSDFVLALDHEGQIWSWGDNWAGQLGINSNEPRFKPVKIESLRNIVAISAFGYHALALDASGQVWGWGKSDFYQAPSVRLQLTDVPMKFPDFDDAIAISAGVDITTVLDSSGQVWVVGYSGVGDFFEDGEIVYEEPHLVMIR